MKLITAPTSEPITLAEAKLHLKIETADTDEDTWIEDTLIPTARQMVEEYTRRALLDQTWELQMDSFSETEYSLEKTPVQSITSVMYYDADSVEQTLSSSVYTLDESDEPNKIILAYDQSWPTNRGFTNDVKIRFLAGYASAALVPGPLKSAMLLIIGHLYENREEVITGTMVTNLPKGSEYLMNPYRLFTF